MKRRERNFWAPQKNHCCLILKNRGERSETQKGKII